MCGGLERTQNYGGSLIARAISKSWQAVSMRLLSRCTGHLQVPSCYLRRGGFATLRQSVAPSYSRNHVTDRTRFRLCSQLPCVLFNVRCCLFEHCCFFCQFQREQFQRIVRIAVLNVKEELSKLLRECRPVLIVALGTFQMSLERRSVSDVLVRALLLSCFRRVVLYILSFRSISEKAFPCGARV